MKTKPKADAELEDAKMRDLMSLFESLDLVIDKNNPELLKWLSDTSVGPFVFQRSDFSKADAKEAVVDAGSLHKLQRTVDELKSARKDYAPTLNPVEQLSLVRSVALSGDEQEIAEAAEMAGIPLHLMSILSQLDDTQLRQAALFAPDVSPAKSFERWQSKLAATTSLPFRRAQSDFFVGDIIDVAFKDDIHSMSAPIFSLSTKADHSVWKWQSAKKERTIEVKPSSLGRATMHDKDILLYAFSQVVEGKNLLREDAAKKTIRFRIFDFLLAVDSSCGKSEYAAVIDGVERLHGTQIKTNIKTGRGAFGSTAFFHLIETGRIVEDPAHGKANATVEITLSDWLYNAIQTFEVCTIAKEYFRLRKPLEKRMYEIARKECNKQLSIFRHWDTAYNASGSTGTQKEFRRAMRTIVAADATPEYKFSLSDEGITISPRVVK